MGCSLFFWVAIVKGWYHLIYKKNRKVKKQNKSWKSDFFLDEKKNDREGRTGFDGHF